MPFKKLITVNKKLLMIIFVIFYALLFVNGEEVKNQGRDFHNYYSAEDDKTLEHQIHSQPPKYFVVNEGYSDCGKNPIIPLLGRGLNLFLLKFGVLGILKIIIGFVFLFFIAKIPILLLKFTFLKSLFLPFLIAPLLFQIFSHPINEPSNEPIPEKPSETPENIMGMDEMNMEMERQMTNNLTSVAWESVKMFAESDQCIERISCTIGAANTDSSIGKLFSRMLKFLYLTSPPRLQGRMALIRDAFLKGSQTLKCSADEYKCQSPELLIQYGLRKVKVL